MKRVGYLLERIAEPDNLRDAFYSAARTKSGRNDVLAYRGNLEENLVRLRRNILDESVAIGGYRQFTVYDPKERIITVAPFAQRVLHHAIMRVGEPYLENRLHAHTYACRKGKGRLAALGQAGRYCRMYPWYLKLDIRKYFDSIPHERLLLVAGRIFKDPGLLRLLGRIVGSFQVQPGHGLPIGNLTSQHLANQYLGGLDRFLENFAPAGCVRFARYMDDTLVWSADRDVLRGLRHALREFIPRQLGLDLKQDRIGRIKNGLPFLGCTLFPSHRELNRRSRVRFARRSKLLARLLAEGRIAEVNAQQRATAMAAYARTASSLRFRWNFFTNHLRASALGWPEAPTAASAAAAGTTTRTTAPWPTATTTTRATATTTSASAPPAAPELSPDGDGIPEPAAAPLRRKADKTREPRPA